MINDSVRIDKEMIGRFLAGVCPLLTAEKIGEALSVLAGEKQAVFNAPQPIDSVIKQKDAAKLLGISTKALLYHVRKGRVREVKLEGSTRAFGYVRSDILNLLNGTYSTAA